MYQLNQIAQLTGITFRSEKEVSEVDERFKFSQTFAIVAVHADRLALTEGTESDHVLVRVEGHAVESRAVTKLRVDSNLVT